MVLDHVSLRNVFDSISYRVARTREELEQAFNLVYEEYLKQGYINDDPSRMWFSLQNILPETTTLVALVDDIVVATATIIPNSPLGLPMDDLYHEELEGLRRDGKKFCEISMLAHNSDLLSERLPLMFNAKKMFLVFFLFRYILDFIRTQTDIQYICIAINPKHESIYESLYFKHLGPLRSYAKVNGAPAIAKILDISTIEEESAASSRKNLYRMFFSGTIDPCHFQGKIRLTPEDIAYFLNKRFGLASTTQQDQLAYIRGCYPDYNLAGILP